MRLPPCPDPFLPYCSRLVDGAFFLDANPEVFSVILDFLRFKIHCTGTDVKEMGKYQYIWDQAWVHGL